MTAEGQPRTGADLLVRRLREYGVRHVFGYPGGPLTPLYDALYREPAVRHVLARDEQGAGFMADGHARATGRPGVCIAVCGPGAFNAATPVATAFSDSVPVLLLNGQVPSRDPRSGYYHENDQLSAFASFTRGQFRADEPGEVVPALDRAWAAMTEGRPGPVLLDLAGKALWSKAPETALPPLPPAPKPRPADAKDIQALARLIAGWRRPLLMAGGGVLTAGAAPLLAQVAERLGAPVFHTLMGKCAIPSAHPLAAGLPWRRGTSDASDMGPNMSPLFAEADGMLAVGCRFTQVTTGTWALKPPRSLAQIDIDPAEFGRHYPVALGVHADAREALAALLEALPAGRREPWAAAGPPREPWAMYGMDLPARIRRALPRDAVVVADVTQLAYRMIVDYPVYEPRTFLHPAGMVSMGYGLPAAVGVRAAFPDRPVVAVMGDGCFQMTGMELATAVQEKLPVVVVVINDRALTLIKAIQHRRYAGRFIGVDLRNPDFPTFARAFGVRAWTAETEDDFEKALREAVDSGETALVEMRVNNPRA
ncbi:MAG TPA: thiamine pyrophosphate-binding protein [Gemmataceae bacterium]|nr:thiamine pyrophosphate-binding protein [Gemmataceae bacterium]